MPARRPRPPWARGCPSASRPAPPPRTSRAGSRGRPSRRGLPRPGRPERRLRVVDGPHRDPQAEPVRGRHGARREERDVEVERRRLGTGTRSGTDEVVAGGRLERLPREPRVRVRQGRPDSAQGVRGPAPGHRHVGGRRRDRVRRDLGVLRRTARDHERGPAAVEPLQHGVEPGDPVETVAEAGDLAPRHLVHTAGVAPQSSEGLVVEQDGDTVGRPADVDLDHLRAERLRDRDGGHRVLPSDPRRAAPGDQRRTRPRSQVTRRRCLVERRHPGIVPPPGEPPVTRR